jgi:hypothetical protein
MGLNFQVRLVANDSYSEVNGDNPDLSLILSIFQGTIGEYDDVVLLGFGLSPEMKKACFSEM